MKNTFFCICLLLISTACLGPVSHLYPEDKSERPVPVYVTSHGWHVGIVTQTENVLSLLPEIENLPETRYLEFGWGDAGYYPHPNPGLGELLNAALWPTPSVVHISGFDAAVHSRFPNSKIVKLCVSEKGMEELAKFLAGTIKTDKKNQAIFVTDGLYGESLFLEAYGLYYLPNTSNLWAARALRAAGLPITPVYALTEGNVIYQARQAGEQLR
ncbi:MAG: DUF2459 domain-containing protein [Balneolaceae bacterium]